MLPFLASPAQVWIPPGPAVFISGSEQGANINMGVFQPPLGWWWIRGLYPIQCGAPKIAKLVYNSNNYGLWMFMVPITIVIIMGVYKPTYNWGALHCRIHGAGIYASIGVYIVGKCYRIRGLYRMGPPVVMFLRWFINHEIIPIN